MICIYNTLPQSVVDAASVNAFQHLLHGLVRRAASEARPLWPDIFSPRVDHFQHPLRALLGR